MLKLKEIREDKGLTQQELANLLNIHKITISKYERGVLNLSSENIIKFCLVLGITPNDLLGFKKVYKSYNEYLMSLNEKKRD